MEVNLSSALPSPLVQAREQFSDIVRGLFHSYNCLLSVTRQLYRL